MVEPSREDWPYFSFHPLSGAALVHRFDNLSELVFRRKNEAAEFQQVFTIQTHLDSYNTKDLFSEHPSKPGKWRYEGRLDDTIVLSTAQVLYVANMERVIGENPLVGAVVIGGTGRPKPFVLIEAAEGTLTGASDKAGMTDYIDAIWPSLQGATEVTSTNGELTKELVVVVRAGGSRPFARTPKGSVDRTRTLAAYEQDIEALYVAGRLATV